MTFGPSELAQLMQEAQATIAVAMLSSVGAGIVFGSIIACSQQSFARNGRERGSDPPIFAATRAGAGDAIAPAQSEMAAVDASAGRIAPCKFKVARHLNRIGFPVTLFAVTIVLAVGGGALYWYHTSSAPPAPLRRSAAAPPPRLTHQRGQNSRASTANSAFNLCPRTWNVSSRFRVDLLS